MLYITIGLGEPLGTTTTVLTAVACGYIVAALVAGRVGDRFGLLDDLRLLDRVRARRLRGRPGADLALVVPAGRLPGDDRGRRRDDAGVGTCSSS